ncbi:hypothetical protein ACN28I_16700 [Archangium gephyra]|uniref:hypothetical protein n=1 Tax=Archangium gephyra TaxID=48 RepID=UPI003B824CED
MFKNKLMGNKLMGISLVMVVLITACGVDMPPDTESEEPGTVQSELLRCGALCPYGYLPSYYLCLSSCGTCSTGGGWNAVQCDYVGTRASISASPQTVSVAAGAAGTTKICWSTTFLTQPVWIRVRVDGGPGKLFTKESDNGSACEYAKWIVAGHSYVFSIHTSDSDSAPVLASTTVTGVLAP